MMMTASSGMTLIPSFIAIILLIKKLLQADRHDYRFVWHPVSMATAQRVGLFASHTWRLFEISPNNRGQNSEETFSYIRICSFSRWIWMNEWVSSMCHDRWCKDCPVCFSNSAFRQVIYARYLTTRSQPRTSNGVIIVNDGLERM